MMDSPLSDDITYPLAHSKMKMSFTGSVQMFSISQTVVLLQLPQTSQDVLACPLTDNNRANNLKQVISRLFVCSKLQL